MGKLKSEFLHKRNKYLPILHQRSKKYNSERKNIVLRFLNFCEQKNISQIEDIRERHYQEYMKILSKEISPQTIVKHKKILRNFFENANLKINVNTKKYLDRYAEKITKRVINLLKEKENISLNEIQEAIYKAILGSKND